MNINKIRLSQIEDRFLWRMSKRHWSKKTQLDKDLEWLINEVKFLQKLSLVTITYPPVFTGVITTNE